jgi:hypothetical protein
MWWSFNPICMLEMFCKLPRLAIATMGLPIWPGMPRR